MGLESINNAHVYMNAVVLMTAIWGQWARHFHGYLKIEGAKA